jgi:hypothetical protein
MSPGFRIHIGEPYEGTDARCIDKGVDTAQTLSGFFDGGLAGFGAGHVTRDRQCPFPRFFGGPLQSLLPTGQQSRLGAALGQPDADASPESARRSYDNRSQRFSSM